MDNAQWQREGRYDEAQTIVGTTDARSSDLVTCAPRYFSKEARRNQPNFRSHTSALFGGATRGREQKVATRRNGGGVR